MLCVKYKFGVVLIFNKLIRLGSDIYKQSSPVIVIVFILISTLSTTTQFQMFKKFGQQTDPRSVDRTGQMQPNSLLISYLKLKVKEDKKRWKFCLIKRQTLYRHTRQGKSRLMKSPINDFNTNFRLIFHKSYSYELSS